MKKIKILTLLLCCLLSMSSCSQTLNKEDAKSRNKADSIIEKFLEKETKNRSYVLFSTTDENYIIIIENTNSYNEFYIKDSKEIVPGNTYSKPNELLKKMFNKDIYQKEFITFKSDFFMPDGYELSSGNITYFVLKDENRNRYGEARLSVLIKPNPIDGEIYAYLVEKLLKQ